ncbi:MAG: HAMP domain-containing histidine kinase [Treponema sp.]|jgi:two-component system sensor histidine kinase HydH|nr:HAMP domain-containing histidine kinase [Treponema sp.]
MASMKSSLRLYSRIAAWASWALLSALCVFISWGLRDRVRLIRDNENERLLSTLITSLREHDSFGSAIEADPVLRERITGFAVYGEDLRPGYAWGTVPPFFNEALLQGQPADRFGRYTVTDTRRRTVKFVLSVNRSAQRRREGHNRNNGDRRNQQGPPDRFSPAFAAGKYLYTEVAHPAYWRTITATAVLLPLCCAGLFFAVFYIRRLYLRNREYQDRIEAQKNLVVLGTAASTLAHEIKNPLLSIRIQTGILKKLYGGTGQEELAIINEEVDRISALIYRVNDYLRDARGEPEGLDCHELLAETFRRLCGGELDGQSAAGKPYWVWADRERLRSVFENLLRNALESGGPAAETGASLCRNAGWILVEIRDRGRGVSPEDLRGVFDPFFTRKSGGTGIGLNISKRFVEAAGGSLRLENREGGGALARIALPEARGNAG